MWHDPGYARDSSVGRNNWTFLGSDRVGKTFAILRSFVASCKLLKLDPFEWLRDVLPRIPTYSIQQLDQLDSEAIVLHNKPVPPSNSLTLKVNRIRRQAILIPCPV